LSNVTEYVPGAADSLSWENVYEPTRLSPRVGMKGMLP
jgi:hypothetical protein